LERKKINIVWLKRDLRTQDHAALYAAESEETPYLIIYLIEPTIISYPDTSLRHLQFQYHSILQMQSKLEAANKKVHILYAEAINAFMYLNEHFEIKKVFSYQESGIKLTFKRDLAVKTFLKENNIIWTEFQRDGILRGIKNRTGWDKAWYQMAHSEQFKNTYSESKSIEFVNPFPLPGEFEQELNKYPKEYQPAGEDFGQKYLQTFTNSRAANYSKHISKPLESRTSCSRLSPYLAWGNLSIKQVYQALETAKNSGKHKRPIDNAITRLHWHCHFIQKFETECEYETRFLNAAYNQVVWNKNDVALLAWKEGKTGIPLIDACMRALWQTGWINFRMRAMVVSFLCHHLFLDWRTGVYHLANLFLDYEPGIHYSQFQMQAGTTGINLIRIYNPIKQSQEHDPNGVFIKKWIPELQNVPDKYIHEPWKMPLMEQELANVRIGTEYPAPIIEPEKEIKNNRDKIWAFRKTKSVKINNPSIVEKHARPRKKSI
jgi:deoxyribodipyrimidine photo-lyase